MLSVRVSLLWHYWHLGPLWGAVLCTVACSAVSLASLTRCQERTPSRFHKKCLLTLPKVPYRARVAKGLSHHWEPLPYMSNLTSSSQ